MNAINSNLKRVSARNNPFAVQRTDAVPFDFSETPFNDTEAFYLHARKLDYRGAIRGRHGRGKTALLCDLAAFFRDQDIDCELAFLPREKELQQQMVDRIVYRGTDGDVVLVDGIERLPLLARHRLISRSKSFGGFIATTHHVGRLRTLIHCKTSEQTLRSVLKSLDLDQPAIVEAALPLVARNRGNLRSVLRELYDQFADGKIG